jgi:ubiquinone/menaquinone biosynthesis C-methylase UbiE
LKTNEVRKTDYAGIAHYYDEARPEPAGVWIKTIVELAGIVPESRVLDVGCGTGRFAVKVRRHHDGQTYGVDNSVEMLRKAAGSATGEDASGETAGDGATRRKARADKATRTEASMARRRPVHWIAGDAHSLPLKSDSVDCAYMTMVIHHIEKPGTALREMRRVLRPGGRCLMMTSSHSAIRAHVLRHFPGVVATDLRRFPAIPALKAAMRKAGFKNVRSSLVTHHEEEIPVEKYLAMVRKKYISTFSVMDERRFERGLEVFEERLARLYGKRMRRTLAFTFVTGDK